MNKKKIIKFIAIVVAVIILAGITSLLVVFRGELGTLLNVSTEKEGIYTLDYIADYKLDQLLEEGGASNEEELVQYILRIMLKGLPIEIEYKIPELGCSTFIAETPEKGYIFGRNFDNQVTDLAVINTAPKNGYKSVSVINTSFIGYSETYKPDKILDRINMLASPYFPLDGVNEKGLAVGVLQLQAPPTDQKTDKVDIGTTLAIRILLDKCSTVKEAVEMLGKYDMHASAKGCYHLHIADASGDSVVVSYVNNEMVVTEKEGDYQCATNFYLHDVPFEYEEQGKDRYEKLVEVLGEKNGILSTQDGIELLNYVSIEKTEPDELGRVYSTQWSSIYDLNNAKLILCVDRDYDNPIEFPVE
ncbi:MAG: linear amide C-N hydrolase [Clostridia bacterium]|nr:linear amide C-N hydrolase [Clostridia bacterium]